MSRYIDLDNPKVVHLIANLDRKYTPHETTLLELSNIAQALVGCVEDDICHIGTLEQIKWERNIAISQLESYGVSFGEKADLAKVVRCKDCKYNGCTMSDGDDWFCADGERKD